MSQADITAALRRLPGLSCALLYRTIHVGGMDAESFLQGQLTLDLRRLSAFEHRLTAWCNAKGRVWALPRIARLDDGFTLILPSDQVEAFVRRLRMFVLRAKVDITPSDDSVRGWICAPSELEPAPGTLAPPRWRLGPHHGLAVGTDMPQEPEIDVNDWLGLSLLAGEARIDAHTQEQFLPQALDLQAQNGLHFNKGCFVGQEIVARVHYRGRAPERLNLLIDPAAEDLAPRKVLCEVSAGGHRLVQVVEPVAREPSD